MKEYMLLIRNEGEAKSGFSSERNSQFLKACEAYIGKLKKNGNMISAQPLVLEGKMISGTPESFQDGPFSATKEVIVGYYHILAKDLDEAIAIEKQTRNSRLRLRPGLKFGRLK